MSLAYDAELARLQRSIATCRLELDLMRQRLAARRRDCARRRFEYELAALRLKAALGRARHFIGKAGFKPDQPRWPKGNGDDSGRWSGGAGTGVATDFSSAGRAKGHHYVPGAIYRKMPLPDAMRKVFDDAITGPLRNERHGWSNAHDQYNEAVSEQLERFVAKHNIRPEGMTPAEARAFVDEVKASRDPRIRGFNLRILRGEVMYWLRRMPRLPE
jgi:hypothetical protein